VLNPLNNYYYGIIDTPNSTDQIANGQTKGNNYSGNLTFVEPMGKLWMLNASYVPSFNLNHSLKKTYDFDPVSDAHTRLDTNLTNVFDNNVFTQKGGIKLRIKKEKWNFTFGADYQNVLLTGNSTYPRAYSVNKTFNNVLPNAIFRLKPTANSNLRVIYRASTNPPSVSQMQSVIDNSNTLQLSTGNPNLKQSFSQMVITRFNIANPKNSRSWFAFVMGNVVNNYVANSVLIARHDTTLTGGVLLKKGSQLSMPVNLNGNWSVRSMLTYSTPWKLIRSTINFNAGASYSVLPGLVTGNLNLSKTSNVNGGITISSNISTKLDFNVSYMGNFNFVTNTLQTQGNSNYVQHLTTARLNWNIWKGLVLSGDATHTLYTGLGSSFTQNYLLWTNSLAYKFGKNKLTELKFTTFDVLKQNNSVTRNVTETYVEDNRQQVLRRYYMLTFTWNFKKLASPQNGPGSGMPGTGMPGTGNPTDKK
jgi:hypothetical protein